jgi:hypothetical protein
MKFSLICFASLTYWRWFSVTLFISLWLLMWRRILTLWLTPSIIFCISFPNNYLQFPSSLKSLCYCTKLYISVCKAQDVILDWVLLADLIAEMHINQLTFLQVKRSACKPRPSHIDLSSTAGSVQKSLWTRLQIYRQHDETWRQRYRNLKETVQ